MNEIDEDQIGPDFAIKGLRNETTLGDEINLIKELATQEICQLLAKNVSLVKNWLVEQNTDEVLITGSSGLISQKLLGDNNNFGVDWSLKSSRAGIGILKAFLEEHRYATQLNIAVVDDVMGSGAKSENILDLFREMGYHGFSFASFVGPREYCLLGEDDLDKAKLAALESSPELAEHLFFPERGQGQEWILMQKLERIVDFYERSPLVRETVDVILQRIIDLEHSSS